ncbi:hypothetical protein [Campylobacter sp. BCW_6463]|nr:hypothetical protein [Campylobacter sp. BCW_6463]OEW43201.1 hypothetical protein AJ884_01935 [Campylobacter sp. BCW_6463]
MENIKFEKKLKELELTKKRICKYGKSNYVKITNPNATKKDIEKNKKKMVEEKESKGSNLIQLRISDKTKEYLQERADSLGFPLNTYIYHLIMKDMETFNQK